MDNKITDNSQSNNNSYSQINNNDKWLLWTSGIIFLLILVPYLCKFHSFSFSSDHAVWGQFSDYVGGLVNPILSILVLWTIVKTLRLNAKAVSQSASALEDTQKDRQIEIDRAKKQNTFEFGQTFQSEEMMKSRLIANDLLKRNRGKSYKLNDIERQNRDKYLHLAKVLNSFRQINVLKHNGLIDTELSKELFGSFYCHFREFFQEIVKSEEIGSTKGLLAQIQELDIWMPHDYSD